MTVFIPGKLRNPLNGSWGGYLKHARIAKAWRELTAAEILVTWINAGRPRRDPRAPKAITFTAHVAAGWDDDNLPAAIKPIRDALVGTVIHSDAPDSGHEFRYAQIIDRAHRGVAITIEALPT